jgi:CRP-like cAMP-binding protein
MNLKEGLFSFFPKSLPLQSTFSKNVNKVMKDKGEEILNIGDAKAELFYINKGVVRGYFMDENNQKKSVWFCGEGDFVTSLNPFIFGLPSKIGIDALEKCELYSIEKDFLDNMRYKYKEVNDLYQKNLEKHILRFENLVLSLQSEDALQRYNSFNMEYPQFANRVPLGAIASFLGITPSTLSKLRAKR